MLIPAFIINGIPMRALSAKVVIERFNIPFADIRPI